MLVLANEGAAMMVETDDEEEEEEDAVDGPFVRMTNDGVFVCTCACCGRDVWVGTQ